MLKCSMFLVGVCGEKKGAERLDVVKGRGKKSSRHFVYSLQLPSGHLAVSVLQITVVTKKKTVKVRKLGNFLFSEL